VQPRFSTILLTELALAILPALLSAQTVGGTEDLHFRFDGETRLDQLGIAVSGAGDVDGDGFDDLIVGAHYAEPNGTTIGGTAYVYSGATDALLYRFDGHDSQGRLGFSVSGAGDVDGDGYADLIVGAPGISPNGLQYAGSAFVYSGATGAQLFRFDGQAPLDSLGHSVSGAGDVDGDGFDDLIVGTEASDPGGIQNAGSAFVYSGATGAQIYRFDGQAPFDFLGSCVCGAGDVDGDGFDDLIVGAFNTDPGGIPDAGSAFVYSGASGAQLYRFDGQHGFDYFGYSVSTAGDVDADGRDDLIVGAYLADPNGLNAAGSAFVYSGATGTELHRFDSQAANDQLGNAVSTAGDVDGDGFDDLIVGAHKATPNGFSEAGSAIVYSGATGELLFRFDGHDANDSFGNVVSTAGDVDHDGRDDLIVGAPEADPGTRLSSGSAYVYSFNPILTASTDSFSISAGGTIDFLIDFPDELAGQAYRVLLSAQGTGPTLLRGLAVPLSPDHYFRESRQGNTPPQGIDFQGTLSAKARAIAHLTATAGSLPGSLVGRTIFLAVVNQQLDFSSVAQRVLFLP